MKTKFDAKKHNLRHRIQKAALANQYDEVCQVAQEIFDADFELGDMELLPTMFTVVTKVLIEKKWSPSIKNKLDA